VVRVVRRFPIVLGASGVVVALLAVTAVALNPGILNVLSPGSETPPSPQAQIDAPAWSVGDTWTYNVTFTRVDDEISDLRGNDLQDRDVSQFPWIVSVTKEVSAIESTLSGDVYNVSLVASLELPSPQDGLLMGRWSRLAWERPELILTDVAFEGYAWYRVDTLALAKDVLNIRVAYEASTEEGAVTASLTVSIVKTFDPALDLWAFPILPEETWSVASVMTANITSVFRLDAPDFYVEVGRHKAFALPILLTAESGVFEEVTTPAGTFQAIPVAFTPQALANLREGTDVVAAHEPEYDERPPRGDATVWFSSDVGAVVRAIARAGWKGLTLEIVLVAYENV